MRIRLDVYRRCGFIFVIHQAKNACRNINYQQFFAIEISHKTIRIKSGRVTPTYFPKTAPFLCVDDYNSSITRRPVICQFEKICTS